MEEKAKKPRYKSLNIDETIYKTYLTKKFHERRAYEPGNPKKLISFIPGTILKVLVKKGQKVKKGDPLLILEAMKMENEILSERAYKVKEIFVKKGEKVPKNTLMMEFE